MESAADVRCHVDVWRSPADEFALRERISLSRHRLG
jgi:hypothetical protein